MPWEERWVIALHRTPSCTMFTACLFFLGASFSHSSVPSACLREYPLELNCFQFIFSEQLFEFLSKCRDDVFLLQSVRLLWLLRAFCHAFRLGACGVLRNLFPFWRWEEQYSISTSTLERRWLCVPPFSSWLLSQVRHWLVASSLCWLECVLPAECFGNELSSLPGPRYRASRWAHVPLPYVILLSFSMFGTALSCCFLGGWPSVSLCAGFSFVPITEASCSLKVLVMSVSA